MRRPFLVLGGRETILARRTALRIRPLAARRENYRKLARTDKMQEQGHQTCTLARIIHTTLEERASYVRCVRA